MACGSYDFFCKPTLPAPDVVVDQSAFNELPVEERLALTQRELQQMKETFRLKESEQEDMQQEMKFHAIKNEELMDVINAFRSTSSDRSHEIMRAKAEQNSELTIQVHSLRDMLTKSGNQIASLQKEIEQKAMEGEKMISHQRTHQRLQVQIKGLTKTLGNVELNSVDIPSEWTNLQWITGGLKNKNATIDDSDKTMQNITNKIIAMEADRQRLLKESKLYNQSDGEKEGKILALERQVRHMQHEKDELQETNNSLKQQLTVRDGKIGALEELFQNINANRTIDGSMRTPDSPNRRNSLLSIDDDEEDCESIDIDSLASPEAPDKGNPKNFEEIFTNIWSNFTGVIDDKNKDDVSISDDEDQEISSCFNQSYHTKQVEEELQHALELELNELRTNNKALCEDFEAAQFKISDLTARLEESNIKANSFQTKAKLRESLLNDVIQQYKELQMENSATNDRMIELKQKVAVLLQLEKERHEQRKTAEAAAAASAASTSALKMVVKGPSVTDMGETPTFELSERTRMTAEAFNEEEGESTSPSTDLTGGLDKNYIVEENKRLEEEYDRLQYEFDSAIEKINDLEESLQEAKEEVKKSLSLKVDQVRAIALLESEKEALQERVIEFSTKIVDSETTHSRATDELRLAEEREKKAREKQLEREKDLWDVIEQYKKLADENQTTQVEMAEVEQELALTQKVKIQRRHLVYEYRKLEKAMEEAVETGEELSRELQLARKEAAVNKEEAKGVRKRLAGCHFHYKELQQHYNDVLKQNEDHERLLAKAQKHESLHKSQAESWAATMENVREKRRAAEEKVDALSRENAQLQQVCSQLKEEMRFLPAEA